MEKKQDCGLILIQIEETSYLVKISSKFNYVHSIETTIASLAFSGDLFNKFDSREIK